MPEIGDRANAASLESVLVEFDSAKGHLDDLCRGTRSLIERLLGTENLQVHSVQARVKSKEKLSAKYADSAKAYCKLSDVTDLVGLRIITYYEDEMDAVAEMLKREFAVDSAQSVDRRVVEPDRFGYFALNLVCLYTSGRLSQTEYKGYAGRPFEIQVTSILRHAWSEMEHDWYDLKDLFPPAVKRKFYRLAALLELAEQEFVEIRKSKRQHERVAFARVEAEMSNVAVDVASLRAFIEQEQLVGRLDLEIARILGRDLSSRITDEILHLRVRMLSEAGLKTVEDVRSTLRQYEAAIPQYVQECSHLTQRRSIYERGVSLFQFSIMLFAKQGEARLRTLMDELNLDSNHVFDLRTHYEIAVRVMSQHNL
jgi:ppGpp synthetase/RelA/SpoT-type nucleotidyltranferase